MIRTERPAWGASLAFALAMVGCGAGSAPKLTPEQEAGATAMCAKMQACDSGSSPSSADLDRCKAEIAGSLQIFPDPQAFAACVNALTCQQLEDDTLVTACVDWDTATLKCSTTVSGQLDGCSKSGKCASASCADVCKLMGGSYDHCGNDSSRGWDVCWCR